MTPVKAVPQKWVPRCPVCGCCSIDRECSLLDKSIYWEGSSLGNSSSCKIIHNYVLINYVCCGILKWNWTKLCGNCGGAVDSIISVFRQPRSGLKLELWISLEPIWEVVADLLWRRGKMSRCFKSSTFFVLQQCESEVGFQRKGYGVSLKLLLQF